MIRFLFLGLFMGCCLPLWALNWSSLWLTPNQQAHKLMENKQFKEAEVLFTQTDWQAAAAYKAGHYKKAAALYEKLGTEQGYYNAGNALAHLRLYEKALASYQQALHLNPNDKDARYNYELVKKLLEQQQNKEQQNQKQQNQEQQNKEQQNQEQQDKEQQNQEQQDKEQQDKEQQDKEQQNKEQQNKEQQDKEQQDKEQQDKEQQDKEQQDKEQQDKEQQDKEQQNKEQQNKEQQDKEQQDKEQQDKEQQDKEQQDKEQKEKQKNKSVTASEQNIKDKEKEQEKEQWLKLIPDDPGGLLREKFLRDHLRRARGWYQ